MRSGHCSMRVNQPPASAAPVGAPAAQAIPGTAWLPLLSLPV
jgi:hypothetical protein